MIQQEIRTQHSIKLCTPLLAGPWSCCDLYTFWPKYRCIHPFPKMHQCWEFGEIQSSNFQGITLTRPKGAFSSMLGPIITWTLTFWPQNLKHSVSSKMDQCWKFGKNTSNTLQDYSDHSPHYACLDEWKDARRARKQCPQQHYVTQNITNNTNLLTLGWNTMAYKKLKMNLFYCPYSTVIRSAFIQWHYYKCGYPLLILSFTGNQC